MQRIALCLNPDDPYQKELLEFVSFLPNGKKRNASAFLKMLVDREYQKKKEEYLAEKKRFEHEKETLEAPPVEGFKPGIKYIPKST